MKRFLVEVCIIVVLWFTHFWLCETSDTARLWFDAAVVVFAAKGIVWEYKDWGKITKGEQ